MTTTQQVTRFLGWFSVGLGVLEIVAPGRLTRALGMRERRTLARTAFGAREVGAGVGILTAEDPTPFVLTRVVGDGLDLVALLRARYRGNPHLANVDAAIAASLGVTALDVLTATALARAR